MSVELDLVRPTRIHLVYVGGKAMSAMAEILVAMGHTVSGSDPNEVPVLERLRNVGVEVRLGADPALLRGVELVACSSAVPPDHPELVEAQRLGLEVIRRPLLQGAIARTRRAVAISGTHGKTTTSAMLATILSEAGLDPSFIVGGDLGGEAGGVRWGAGEWLVVEADESDGTFLELGAEAAVLTSVAADHLDYHGSLDAIESGFDRFLAEARTLRVVCVDDPLAARIGSRHGALGYGTSTSADIRVSEVAVDRATTRFVIAGASGDEADVVLPVPGRHNALNAAAAITVATQLGVTLERAAAALASYRGVGRRFELKGRMRGVTVVDDYAHNPGKVEAVIDAAAAGGWGRVVVAFQPHRFSRTAALWRDFRDSFAPADVVFITELDPAGEVALPGVSGRLVADAVRDAHPTSDVRWVPERRELLRRLVAELRPDDLCLVLGAGDVTQLGDELLGALEGEA